MSELVAIEFDNSTEADRVLNELRRLQKEYLVDLEDAVVVYRPPNGDVQLKQSIPLVKTGAIGGGLSGSLWGTLVGLLFLNPLAGFAIGGLVGAGAGALSGSLADYGINDEFIKDIGKHIPNGSSALFVLIKSSTPDKVLPEIQPFNPRVLRTSLSKKQEDALRDALEHKPAAA